MDGQLDHDRIVGLESARQMELDQPCGPIHHPRKLLRQVVLLDPLGRFDLDRSVAAGERDEQIRAAFELERTAQADP
jgi:hypothetical protein